MTPSIRTREATKTALAMTIAYGISLQAGWDKPYWAGFAIAFISLATVGQSLNKGALRMAGTLLAAVVALGLIALFAQQRWLFIFFLTLWFAFCAYMNSGPKYSYFWFVAAFVSLIIAADSSSNFDGAFAIAVLRTKQTGLGILVYTLVSLLLWPTHSRKDFEKTTLALLDTQQKLLLASMALLTEKGSKDKVQALRTEEIADNTRLAVLLDAAVSDSEQIRQAELQWRKYQSTVAELAETMQHWRENFAELPSLPLPQLLPGLDVFGVELDARFDAVAQILSGKAVTFRCSQPNLEPDRAALNELSHFHRAALLVTRNQLSRIDALTRTMVDTISAIRGFTTPAVANKRESVTQNPFAPDLDRLLSAGKIMLMLWLAFLAVIYIPDFPGGMGFVSMCGPIGLIMMNSPQMPVSALFKPVAVGFSFAAALYIFLMPQLSSFTGLGLMLFCATFFICYRYATPQQGLGRAISLAMLVTVIAVSNQQSYNFLSVANTALMWVLLFLLLAIVSYIPFSVLPDRALLRLLRRYLLSAEFLLSRDMPNSNTASLSRREVFHRQEIASLPGKMQTWAAQASPAVLGAESSQQLPDLVGALQALSYRLLALQEARALPQSPLLVAALTDDMQQWRHAVLNTLQQLSVDPTDTDTLSRARLDNKLAQLDTRIAEVLDSTAADSLSDNDHENFYRLLGAYRGSSETLLDFAGLASTIDWQPWREERFA